MCYGGDEPQLQYAFCFCVLPAVLECKLLLEKYSRNCKLFPNFHDTSCSICLTSVVRNVLSGWQVTHFSAANSTSWTAVWACECDN